MTPADRTRTTQARTIFEEASDRPPAERDTFVAEACGGDDALRAEVESLLRAADSAGGFLSAPQVPARPATDGAVGLTPLMAESLMPGRTPQLVPAEVEGSAVGRYKLREQIGEGGFGVVFRAEQERPVCRTVALKIIKLGMDSRQVVARFQAERQALALMDHPGIARVFDGGTTDTGRPYFVMELVEGPPITVYCDRHSLPLRQRLDLFAQVCDAVHHAHQKGVIHRDLKPSNVLVAERDGRPVPKVIDFGVAKAVQGRLTEHSLHTEHRQLVGTPVYMSPEQAAMGGAAVDTRSDVYGLGVLLYELLTGTTPFDAKELQSKSVGEVERILREVEPPAPSERVAPTGPSGLRRALRGELDWVAMRCLEKDPARRYESAAALAEDVRRHLAGEVVMARPSSAAYRMRKYARRHKAGVAAAAVAAAAVLMGVVGTSVGMLRARAAEQEAKAGTALAESDAAHAQAAYEFVREILEGASPYTPGGGRDARIVDLLDRAVAKVDERLGQFPEAALEAYHTLSRCYSGLGMQEKQLDVMRRSYALSQRVYGPDHPVNLKMAGGFALNLCNQRRNYDEVERLCGDGLERARRVLGEGHCITRHVAQGLARCYSLQGRFTEAEALLRRTLAVPPDIPVIGSRERTRVVGARFPYEVTVMLLQTYAEVERARGRPAAAEALARQAQDVLRQYPGLGPVLRMTPDWELAWALAAQDRTEEAEEALGRVMADANQSVGSGSILLPEWLARHAEVLTARRKFPEALRARQRLLDLARADGANGAALADPLWDVADLLWLTGERDKAREMSALADAAAGPAAGKRPNSKWRRAAIRPALGREEEWADPGLHAQMWGLADKLLYDLFDARAVADEFEAGWPAARFTLARWDGQTPRQGAAADTRPVAAGTLADAKQVRDLAPGLYRLSLEIPRRGDAPPLRREAWVPLCAWEVQRYHVVGWDRAQWGRVLQNNHPPKRTVPSLVLAEGLTLDPGPGGLAQDFGIVATSRIELPAGTYLLRVTCDDAVRVSVDGRRAAGAWTGRAATTDTGRVELAGGAHELRVEYLQGMQEFNLRLEIEPAAPGAPVPDVPDAELDYLAGRIAREPTDRQAWAARANLFARRGRFEEAEAHFNRALELGPGGGSTWPAAAALRLHAGDLPSYREHCRRMLEAFKDSKDVVTWHRLAHACLVAPGAVTGAELDAACALIDRALGDDRPEAEWRHRSFMEVTKGIADYRRGRYADAARRLGGTVERPLNDEVLAVNYFFLAMAHHRLGDRERAESLHRQGVHVMEELPAAGADDLGGNLSGTGWTIWVQAHAARRECEAVLAD